MHRSKLPFLMPKGEFVADRDESDFEGSCKVQILRSSSKWSSDIEREHSIYNAYIECIAYSKHFIYIENQFFISATQEDKVLRNKIAQALVERIRRAHEKGENYRVYIIIPLIPAFEGDLAASESSSARSVMHFQYISISRGGNSIMERLREYGIDPDQYINWFSLRNHGQIKVEETEDERHKYVSELLYIHDKLMIVDDKIVIMGSANINDRSMAGNRDSEIAMIIEDTETIPSYMDGKEYQAAKFAHTLRMQLWKEHLGLLNFNKWENLLDDEEKAGDKEVDDLDVARKHYDHSYPLMTRSINNSKDIQDIETDQPAKMLDRVSRSMSVFDRYRKHHKFNEKRHDAAVLDPLSERFYQNIWLKTANTNTEIYRKLFRCVPDDTVHTYEQHHQFVPNNDTTQYGHIADPDLDCEQIETELDLIKGHLN
ncbi:phospholipase D/nuclease [Backusella circina FSU 941]|nr:phospholipase D/nuclease [Backusella circina FSU 941]